MKTLSVSLSWLALLLASVAVANDPVSPLDAMVGEWQGEGWVQRGPQRSTFDSHETVRKVLDGTAWLIEGRHFRSGTQESVHNALALVRPGAADGEYRMHSWLSDGREMEAWGRREGEEFHWGFSLPDGSRDIRYRLRVTDGTWTEIGETRAAGQPWMKFFEMTLRKQRQKN